VPRTELPPFATLETALHRTTEQLAVELAAPASERPDWTDLEWRIARAAAAMQGTGALLDGMLRWRGPERWQAFLAEQRRQSILRHAHVMERLCVVDSGARAAGIAVVPLKGAALYRAGIYAPGNRPMGDIDLLVRPSDVPAAKRLLLDLGYEEAFENRRHAAFAPRAAGQPVSYGEHVGNPVKVELHSRIAEPLPVDEVEITAAVMPAGDAPGLREYPSPAALMLHLLLHAAGNVRARALRQIQLHDVALLARRFTAADWESLLGSVPGPRGAWWAYPPLALTARYYPDAVPAVVLDASRRGCPRALVRAAASDRLRDVSWARLRIQAFPGIEWSRTAAEAVRFARSRLLPKREALAELQQLAATQSWAREIPWYGQSHLVRIARWLVSRPPRVQTLYSVRAALAEP
jgi:hypothetical protein